MLKQFSNKQKFYLLLGGFVLFFVLAYQLAFSETLKAWEESKETERRLEKVSSASGRLQAIKKKMLAQDAVIGRSLIQDDTFRAKLLLSVSETCRQQHVKMLSLPEIHVVKKDRYEIETHRFYLSGKYKNMLGVLYELEKKRSCGMVKSVRFYKERDLRKQHKETVMEVYVQAVKRL